MSKVSKGHKAKHRAIENFGLPPPIMARMTCWQPDKEYMEEWQDDSNSAGNQMHFVYKMTATLSFQEEISRVHAS